MQPGFLQIDGFDYTTIGVGPSSYAVGIAGQGPPVLLLHGFPQNQYCWHRVAPALSREHTVVLCDLKGCGESRAPRGGPLGEGYSKREMAVELVQVMADFGFGRFAVVGHDRGGRVAYRMALDSPAAVDRLCVLNIVPTSDQFERMAAAASNRVLPLVLPRAAAAVCRAARERECRVFPAPYARRLGGYPRRDRSGGDRPLRRSLHTGRRLRDVLGLPRGVPHRPRDGRRGSCGRAQDPLPAARALGCRGSRDVGRPPGRLAPLGGRRLGLCARLRSLHPRGGARRPRRLPAGLPRGRSC